ncbi:MAG: hypothetical protein H0T62_02115 [Parachlamydiaceae bacterium]|nr:hypothetical protein [Parachlamydiaceae bacterium]
MQLFSQLKHLSNFFTASQNRKIPLYVLFIREQRVSTAWDSEREWYEGEGCRKVLIM